jgi:hypothetical protein
VKQNVERLSAKIPTELWSELKREKLIDPASRHRTDFLSSERSEGPKQTDQRLLLPMLRSFAALRMDRALPFGLSKGRTP